MPYSENGSMSMEKPDDVFTKENPFINTEKSSDFKNAQIKQRNSVSLENLEEREARNLKRETLFPSMRGVKLPYEVYSADTAKGIEEDTEFFSQTTPHNPLENETAPSHGTRTVQTPPPLELFYEQNTPEEPEENHTS